MTISRGDLTWKTDLVADLTGRGTDDGLAVGQLAQVTEPGSEGIYECATAAAATSTWNQIIGGGGGSFMPLFAQAALDTGPAGPIATAAWDARKYDPTLGLITYTLPAGAAGERIMVKNVTASIAFGVTVNAAFLEAVESPLTFPGVGFASIVNMAVAGLTITWEFDATAATWWVVN